MGKNVLLYASCVKMVNHVYMNVNDREGVYSCVSPISVRLPSLRIVTSVFKMCSTFTQCWSVGYVTLLTLSFILLVVKPPNLEVCQTFPKRKLIINVQT